MTNLDTALQRAVERGLSSPDQFTRPVQIVAKSLCKMVGGQQCICRHGHICLSQFLYGDYAAAAVGALTRAGIIRG